MGFLSVLARVATGVGDAVTAMGERYAADVARHDAKSDADLLAALQREARSDYPCGRDIAIMRRLADDRGLGLRDIQADARRSAARRAKRLR